MKKNIIIDLFYSNGFIRYMVFWDVYLDGLIILSIFIFYIKYKNTFEYKIITYEVAKLEWKKRFLLIFFISTVAIPNKIYVNFKRGLKVDFGIFLSVFLLTLASDVQPLLLLYPLTLLHFALLSSIFGRMYKKQPFNTIISTYLFNMSPDFQDFFLHFSGGINKRGDGLVKLVSLVWGQNCSWTMGQNRVGS